MHRDHEEVSSSEDELPLGLTKSINREITDFRYQSRQRSASSFDIMAKPPTNQLQNNRDPGNPQVVTNLLPNPSPILEPSFVPCKSPDKLSSEFFNLVCGLFSIFNEKIYMEGWIYKKNDMMPDGTKFQARDWVLYYVQLKGSTLKAWKAPDEFQLTCAETLPVPPDTEDWSFVIDPNESEMKMVQEEMQQKIEPLVQNINDAGCEWVGIFAKGTDGEQHRAGLFSLNTAGANRIFIQPIPFVNSVPKFILHDAGSHLPKSPVHWSLQRWVLAIRMAIFEHSLLHLIYTEGLFASSLRNSQSNLGLNQLIYFMEGPLQLRFAGCTEWREFYCVAEIQNISNSSSDLGSQSANIGQFLIFDCPDDVLKCRSKKSLSFLRNSKSKEAAFDQKKLYKKAIAKVENIALAFAVSPETKNLNSSCTLFKLVGGTLKFGKKGLKKGQLIPLKPLDSEEPSASGDFVEAAGPDFISCMAQTQTEMLKWIRCLWTIFNFAKNIPEAFVSSTTSLCLSAAPNLRRAPNNPSKPSNLFMPVEAALGVDMQHQQTASDVFKNFWTCFSKFGYHFPEKLVEASKVLELNAVQEDSKKIVDVSPTRSHASFTPSMAFNDVNSIKVPSRVTLVKRGTPSTNSPVSSRSPNGSIQNNQFLSSVYQQKESSNLAAKATAVTKTKVTKVTRVRYGSDEVQTPPNDVSPTTVTKHSSPAITQNDSNTHHTNNEKNDKNKTPEVQSNIFSFGNVMSKLNLYTTPNSTGSSITKNNFPDTDNKTQETPQIKVTDVGSKLKTKASDDRISVDSNSDKVSIKTRDVQKQNSKSIAKGHTKKEVNHVSAKKTTLQTEKLDSKNEHDGISPTDSLNSFRSANELVLSKSDLELPLFNDDSWKLQFSVPNTSLTRLTPPKTSPKKTEKAESSSKIPKPSNSASLNRKSFSGTPINFPEVSSSSSSDEETDSGSSEDDEKLSKRVVNRRSVLAESLQSNTKIDESIQQSSRSKKPLKSILKVTPEDKEDPAEILRREREQLMEERRQLEIQKEMLAQQRNQMNVGDSRVSLSPHQTPYGMMMHGNASVVGSGSNIPQRLPSPTPSESASMIFQHPNFQPFSLPHQPNPYAAQSVFMAPSHANLPQARRIGGSVVSSHTNRVGGGVGGGGGLISAIISKEKRSKSVAFNPALGITHSKTQQYDIHKSRHEERLKMEREFREQEQMLAKQEETTPAILGYSGSSTFQPGYNMNPGYYPPQTSQYLPAQPYPPYGNMPAPQMMYPQMMQQQPAFMMQQQQQHYIQQQNMQPAYAQQQPFVPPNGRNRQPSETTTDSD